LRPRNSDWNKHGKRGSAFGKLDQSEESGRALRWEDEDLLYTPVARTVSAPSATPTQSDAIAPVTRLRRIDRPSFGNLADC